MTELDATGWHSPSDETLLDLCEVVDGALAAFGNPDARRFRIIREYSGTTLVSASSRHLGRAVTQALSWAAEQLDGRPNGSAELGVRVHTTGDTAVVEISAACAEEPFHHPPNSDRTGLLAAQEIAAAHRGSLTFGRCPFTATVARLTLPCAATAEAPHRETPTQRPGSLPRIRLEPDDETPKLPPNR